MIITYTMILNVELTVFLFLFLTIILLFTVGGRKSIKFLLALACTMVIVLLMIVPLIIRGFNPVWVVLIGAIPITVLIIYITEGFTRLSHLSIIVTLIIFFLTWLLAEGAVKLAHFTGIVSDVATTVGGQLGINLPDLLVAGIMLGTLGILIEMVITQVATVIELIKSNAEADKKQIFRQSFNIGIVHLGSIINTLFLIYAGVALPILIIFLQGQSSLFNVLGYEPVSTEIIRTLIGTLGLIVAMPAATFLAVQWLKKK